MNLPNEFYKNRLAANSSAHARTGQRTRLSEQSAGIDVVLGGPSGTPPAAPPASTPGAEDPTSAIAAEPLDAPADTTAEPESDASSTPGEPEATDAMVPGNKPAPEETEEDHFIGKIVEYMKLVAKPATTKDELVAFLESIPDDMLTGPAQQQFVEANLSSLSLLDETIVDEIRRKMRKASDVESLFTEIETFLSSYPEMGEAMMRLSSAGPDKPNLLRQLLAATCAGVVIPGNSGGEVHLPRKGEPIVLRPACVLDWGYVDLGPVKIVSTSPEEYLSKGELRRLDNGSPDEKRILRSRVFVESLADQLGGVYHLVLSISAAKSKWELAGFQSDVFRDAYDDGTITVLEATVGPDGSLGVDEDGEWATMSSWRTALDAGEPADVNLVTGEQTRKRRIVGELKGERFAWLGDGGDLSIIGAKHVRHDFGNMDPQRAIELKRDVPDARLRLMGRK